MEAIDALEIGTIHNYTDIMIIIFHILKGYQKPKFCALSPLIFEEIFPRIRNCEKNINLMEAIGALEIGTIHN